LWSDKLSQLHALTWRWPKCEFWWTR